MNTGNEKTNVNIAEFLRYAPKGLKLYCPLFGEVAFKSIDDYDLIAVRDKHEVIRWFYREGTYIPNGEGGYEESECMLFPSINHRCWNNWQNTLFLQHNLVDVVCVDEVTGNKFLISDGGTHFSDNTGSCYDYLIENDESNYLLNSRYASPEETKQFFEDLEKNGFRWDGEKVVKLDKKEVLPHKFKVGDVIKFDRPSATIQREILDIDFDKERYVTRRKDNCGALKEYIYFCEQDDYALVIPPAKLSLEDRVKKLEDRVDAIAQVIIKHSYVYQSPDRAGDCVTLEDMKNE